jgi:hypothetical protein
MIDYVGKEVDVGTGMLKFDNKSKLSKGTFAIDQPLGQATLEVRDGSGQVLSQEELGSLMPGEHNVKWQGRLKDGRTASPGIYNFQIVGKSIEGQEVSIPITSKVKITGVDLKTDGGAFFTELGKIAMKDVASVGLEGYEKKAAAAVNQMGTPGKDGKQSAKHPAEGLDQAMDAVKDTAVSDPTAALNPAEAGLPQLPPEFMEMAQNMVNRQENSGTNGPDRDITAKDQSESNAVNRSAPINPSSAPNLSGIKVQMASAGE